MKRLFSDIWMILRLRCAEADRLQAMPATDRTWAQRLALRAHVWICVSCRAAAAQLRRINEALKTMADPEPLAEEPAGPQLTSDARRRLQARLEQARNSEKN